MRSPIRHAALALLVSAPLLIHAQRPERRAAPRETALDRYVAAPDSHYAFARVAGLPSQNAAVTLLKLTSQQWLTDREVTQPVWTHWLTVIRPSGALSSNIGFVFVTGGSSERKPPDEAPDWLEALARDTRTVVAELRMVPNQPIVFADDPTRTPRSEDDFIAYTWDKYLRTGDERWPARLPMTKSVVRAMDAITAFCRSGEGGGLDVKRFVVAGASKRGWTTWTTAAVDPRVVAIAPAVIDVLHVEPSFEHHWRAYGAWASAVDDYVKHGIMDWMGSRQFHALMQIEDPYYYRDRLTMPKLMVNAAGDEFFLPDSARFYFGELPGEKHLRYVPNTNHSLDKTDAIQTVHAFYASVVAGRARPRFTWTHEADGTLKVVARDLPKDVRLWTATNPEARDFRLDTIGAAYHAEALSPSAPNTWSARVAPPARGWTAYFMELTFDSGGTYPLKFTTDIRVTPERMPYPPHARTAGQEISR
jgi:PhoPQ-activated pathogenicity-related protein